MATERERQLLILLQSLTPQAYMDMYEQGVSSQLGEQVPYTGRVIAAGLGGDAIAAADELYQVWEQGYSPEDAARMFSTAISQKDFVVTPEDQEKIISAFMNDVQNKAKVGTPNANPLAAFQEMGMPELAALAPALQKQLEQQEARTIKPAASTMQWLKELEDKANAEITQSQQEIAAYTSGEKQRPKGVFENVAGGFLRFAAPVAAGLGTAGAVMASPFTGGATLAAVPVLAGLAAGTIASGGASAGTNALLNWAYGDKDKKWIAEKTAPELADIAREEERLRYVQQMAKQQGGIAREAQKVFDKRFADFLARQGGAQMSPFDVERSALIRSIGG
jgi:hypothetical protein